MAPLTNVYNFTEFGILHGTDCEKFVETREHFFNVIDGTLSVVNYKDIHHDNYCVDYFLNMSDEKESYNETDVQVRESRKRTVW